RAGDQVRHEDVGVGGEAGVANEDAGTAVVARSAGLEGRRVSFAQARRRELGAGGKQVRQVDGRRNRRAHAGDLAALVEGGQQSRLGVRHDYRGLIDGQGRPAHDELRPDGLRIGRADLVNGGAQVRNPQTEAAGGRNDKVEAVESDGHVVNL